MFSNHFKQFTSWIDPAGAFVGRETGIANYFVKKPGPGAPPAMADQTTTMQAAQLQEAKDASLRYGRAATILSSSGGEVGASDKLGP
jgi:hypothetical protein